MFVEAIINETIDRDYFYVEKGEKITGNVRSYNQDFMVLEEMHDNPDFIGEANEDNYDDLFIYTKTRIIIKKGSVKKVYCGCNKPAIREINNEYLCADCDYEEPHFERLDNGYHAMDYLRDFDD